jgi:peroxiredoxin
MKFYRIFSATLASTVLLMALSQFSCKQNQPPGPSIISGTLPGQASSEIRTWLSGQEIVTITDEKGSFRMELNLAYDHYLWFEGINQNLYLVAGDSMNISANKNDPRAYVYTGGESSLINTWYGVKDEKLASMLDTVDINWYYGLEATSFNDLNSWIISAFFDLLDKYQNENPGLGEAFIALEKSNITHYWYYELNVYHLEHYARTGKKADLPENFYDYLDSVQLNDTLLFQYDGYKYFLYSWLDLQVHLQEKGLKGVQKTRRIFDIAEAAFTVPAILADVSWEILRTQNNRMLVDEDLIARAGQNRVSEEKLEDARRYMKRLQALAPGNPAPDFTLVDLSGNTANLKDFHGDYLLIDVWSHTCGVCIREIPRLEEIKHDLEGQNIEMITVCLSPDEAWRNILNELALPDEGQYRLENGWNSPFNNNYLKGSGVPTYILIDPDGKIVNARAPLPSQGLREVLEDLV